MAMRFSFPPPALAAVILIFPVLTTVLVGPVAAAAIIDARFCPTLKEMMRYTDAFYEHNMTSFDYESNGDKYWFTSFKLEGSKDCYIGQKLSGFPHEYSMYCTVPVLPPTTGQETYESFRQVVSSCISEITPAGLVSAQSTKGIDGSPRTEVGFRFEEEDNTFNVFVKLRDSPDEEQSVEIHLRSWRH